MQDPLAKPSRNGNNVYRNWDLKLLALPILLGVALVGFAVSHPGVSRWISDAVEAEFASSDLAPPIRLAQPTNEIQTVRTY